MVGVNQVFSLADDVVRYVKACGKKSILECKFVQNKIDKKSLYFAKDTIGDTFSLTNRTTFASRIKELSTPGKESETLKKFFSTEFKPKRRFDENGYFVTTVIDKKTQKPVEVFIKEVNDNRYEFYKKVKNEYEHIGTRTFDVNKETSVLEPGFMINHGKDEFVGIGVRGHQLAVEKVMSENLKSIKLSSLPSAELFHEKCLFTPLKRFNISSDELDGFARQISEGLSISPKEAKKLFVYKKDANGFIIDIEQTVVNINKIVSQKMPEKIITQPTMGMYTLNGERLELWKDMVRSQPITI